MAAEEIEKRLSRIEDRLTALEARFAPAQPAPVIRTAPAPQDSVIKTAPRKPAQGSVPTPGGEASTGGEASAGGDTSIATVLGWGGVLALVLAAAYLIRLAIDAGWLTPLRQVGLAGIAGLALIGAGFWLRASNPRYASLLPAGGIVVLFLTVYGAHLHHRIIDAPPALAAVILICIASLWLCRVLDSDLYALFAVVGSYLAPLLIHASGRSLADLAVYFSSWSVVFSAFAIWHGRRLIYLLALYLALIGFDLVRRTAAPGEWQAALAFQSVQFVVFGIATAVFSIRRAPLDPGAALAHLPPLLLFYFLQYAILDEHLPAAAPWIAAATAAVVGLLYGIARVSLQRPLPGGELLLWSYVALVLFHAGYIESVPQAWAPWVAAALFLAAAGVAVVRASREGATAVSIWPLWLAVGLIFLVNYLRVVLDIDLQQVQGRGALAVVYALELYAGFFAVRARAPAIAALLLYAGHVAAMAAALHLIDARIVESTAWALLALACIGIALVRGDRLLGQSSLLVFGATAVKVLLYDLSGAAPIARIVSLVVLGVAFYAGGWLYQRIDRPAAAA